MNGNVPILTRIVKRPDVTPVAEGGFLVKDGKINVPYGSFHVPGLKQYLL